MTHVSDFIICFIYCTEKQQQPIDFLAPWAHERAHAWKGIRRGSGMRLHSAGASRAFNLAWQHAAATLCSTCATA